MRFDMFKIPVSMAVVAGMLVLGGCQGVNAMPKNVLMKEGQAGAIDNQGDYLSESGARKIAIAGFESIFNIKLDVKGFYENVEYDDEYEVSWSSFDPRKLNELRDKMDELDELEEEIEDRDNEYCSSEERAKIQKLNDEIRVLDREYAKSSRYKAAVDLESGKIDRIEIWNHGGVDSKTDIAEKTAALSELEKFLGEKPDVSGLLESIRVRKGVWEFEWESVEDSQGKSFKYTVGMDMSTGEVISASYDQEGGENKGERTMGFVVDTQEAKKIAVDFMVDRKYVKSTDKIEFLSCENIDSGRTSELQFAYGTNEATKDIKVIVLTIDRVQKTVSSMDKYEDDEEEIQEIKEEYQEDLKDAR